MTSDCSRDNSRHASFLECRAFPRRGARGNFQPCRSSNATEATIVSKRSEREGKPRQQQMGHVAEKGCVSEVRYGLMHKPITNTKGMAIPEAKAAVDRHQLFDRGTMTGGPFVLHPSWKHAEFSKHLQNYKGRVVLQGDNVKHDNGYNAVFIHGTKGHQLLNWRQQDFWIRLADFAVWQEKPNTR